VSGWLLKLAILLLALAAFKDVSDPELWRHLFELRGFTGTTGSLEIPLGTAKVVGIVMWAFTALVTAFLLAEVRESSPKVYSIAIIIGSTLIVGYFATHLQEAVAAEQLAGLGGGSIGAIDGFVVLRKRHRARLDDE
jgi:uncharacterized membrane protein